MSPEDTTADAQPGPAASSSSSKKRGPEQDAEMVRLAYEELHSIAAAYMRRERSDHTLQPTALVGEAYARLVAGGSLPTPGGQALDVSDFVGIAARVMRQVLVDHARAHNAEKRGGGWQRATLSGVPHIAERLERVDILALDNAVEKLAAHDEQLARIVEMRFFAGMTVAQTAACLGVSKSKVESDWVFARTWLRRELGEAHA